MRWRTSCSGRACAAAACDRVASRFSALSLASALLATMNRSRVPSCWAPRSSESARSPPSPRSVDPIVNSSTADLLDRGPPQSPTPARQQLVLSERGFHISINSRCDGREHRDLPGPRKSREGSYSGLRRHRACHAMALPPNQHRTAFRRTRAPDQDRWWLQRRNVRRLAT